MPRHNQKHEDVIYRGFVVIAMRNRKSHHDIQCIAWESFFLRLLYFYPQSILDYQYMYVISTTIVYRDLTWGVMFQQTCSMLFYFCVKLFVMRIFEADQLVCSVWAVAVLGLPVGWVLVDLCVGVVWLCERCCVSWFLRRRYVWADRCGGCC